MTCQKLSNSGLEERMEKVDGKKDEFMKNGMSFTGEDRKMPAVCSKCSDILSF